VNQRIITALLVTPLAIAMILFMPTLGFMTIISALCVLGWWEWTRLSGMRSRPWRALLVAAGTLVLVLLWNCESMSIWWTVIGAGCVWWLAVFVWLRHFSFAASPTREHIALKLGAGALTVLPAWAAMMRLHLGQTSPHTWALYALVLIWAADTFAYLAGRRWGTVKLAPQISPGKTMEGVYGALAGSALVAAIGGWLLDVRGITLVLLIMLGLLSVIFSIAGDLFESLIKRHAGVKDSGMLFPGHGGVCDRLDGVFAALPIFALGKFLLGL